MIKTTREHMRYARLLGLSLKEYIGLCERLAGYFQAGEVVTPRVMDAFFILEDIVKKTKVVKAEKWITKSPELREHGADIEKLRQNGAGYGTIKKDLSLKASRSAIKIFCDVNALKEEI